jgi:pilus assembly protein Flp/PilA
MSRFEVIAGEKWETENGMPPMFRFLIDCRAVRCEDGVTAIEYGLIAALIAVAIITAVTLVGTNLSALFSAIAGNL